jgi:hypothetical protein
MRAPPFNLRCQLLDFLLRENFPEQIVRAFTLLSPCLQSAKTLLPSAILMAKQDPTGKIKNQGIGRWATVLRRTSMSGIKKSEAIEKLALAAESASSADDIVEIYGELFPGKGLPDVSGAKTKALAVELARHIRSGIEPEELVDLWNVVFPADRNVYYDEEHDVVRYNEEVPWHAER